MLQAIFIDAGHGLGPTGGIDNGASGNGTTERQEVVEIAQELFVKLQADASFAGMEIIKIGVEDRMMLKDKIQQINDICRSRGWSADTTLLVAIHLNSAGSPQARGLEAWFSKNKPGAFDFAKIIVEQMANATGLPLRPVTVNASNTNRLGRLGILDDTIPRGCLIECGFVSNEFDANVFKNASLDDRFADGIQRGIRQYVGLPPSPVAGPPPAFYYDVPDLAWYKADVELCLREGLLQMPQNGLFDPNRQLTRLEFAAVMARHLRKHHGIS